MIFQLTKYRISKHSSNELVLSLNMNYVKLEITVTLLGCLTFCYFFWDKVDFNSIDIVEISLGALILTSAFNLLRNLKMMMEEENYIFNSSLNSITKNGHQICELSSLYNIDIVEKYDVDSPTEYELQIHLKNDNIICIQKTGNLEFQKTLGNAISSIAGVPFAYAIKESSREKEILKQQAINLKPYIEMFEKKFEGKSVTELEAISKHDSCYAEYAQKAAQNLLIRIKETNNPQLKL